MKFAVSVLFLILAVAAKVLGQSTEYQTCGASTGGDATTTQSTCPSGYTCSNTAYFICQPDSNTTSTTDVSTTTTDTSSTTTDTSSTTTDTSSTTTDMSSTTTDTSSTTTDLSSTPTTLPTTVTTPACNESAVYPGPACNEYYSCIAVMWWFDLQLVTCPSGQAFNQTSGQCEDSTTCS